jgi:predicted amidohydrolase YtcJ
MSIFRQWSWINKISPGLNSLILLLTTFIVSCQQHNADFILRNAHIYTVNSTFDTASVMAVKDGKILAIGGDEVLDAYHALNIINMQGAYIYPGFIDAHTHFTGYAMDKYKLVLYGTKSFEEMVGKVVEYSRTSKREWIEGRLWDHQLWPNKEFPTKDTLDILFPNRPVFLMRIDGHAILCNQKALDLAGVNEHTKVEGGELVLKNGKLTGLLIDNAVDLVKQKIPTRTKEEEIPDIVLAQKDCFKVGLTSLVECGISNKVINWLIEMSNKKTQTLKIGLTAFLSDEEANYKQFLNKPIYSNGFLKIVGYKIFADGSLGSRGAYLTEAYSDRHEHKGQLLKSVDSIKAIALRIVGTPYQLSVHAIGDGTNHEILRIFSDVLDQHNDRRWRIEHAQVVKKDDLPIFEKFHIIPSVQPTHAISDMSWAESRLGVERIKTAYAYQDLLRQNQWLPLGTDFPVEDLNPLNTFCAAVFRQNHELKPEKGYQMENALSREQALKGITIWAAKSTFEESSKGSLEVGKQADFVVLPTDLMKASADSIYKTKVIYTYVKGERVFPDR